MKQTLILISAFLLTASAYPQNTFSHQYDTLGRIVEVIYPNGKKINYSYDKLGNRLTKIQSPCYLPDAPGSINGSQSGCKSASQVYSVNTIPNTSSYQWTLPQGSSGSSTSNSIILFFGPDAITDTLFVQGQNSCGFGEKSFTVIEVKSIPLLPSPILGPSSVCAGQEPVSFSIPSMENVSGYQWVLPDGFSGSSTNNQIDLVISPVATSGWIRVKGLNECGEGQERAKFVTVNPLPMANAGADLTINHGTSTLLSGSASGGSDNYSYSWTPASLLVNSNIQSPHTLNLYQTTTFSLEVTDVATGCTGLADQVTVNITGSPLAAIPSANPSLICTGQSTQLFANATGGSGTYSY
ncbi:MAG: hypothetical protein NTU44_08285, partial [Bacteroidetes bacterium]|nr:hypothetical protein [Bacteroidota bacterium]